MASAKTVVKRFFPQVEEVVDANKALSVEVTERDSANSRLKNHAECALAVACKRKEHADGVVISVSTAYVIKGKKAIRYKVPPSAAREVVSFDRKAGFEPGIYRLSPQPPASRLGSPRRGGKATGESGRKIEFRHETGQIRTSLKKS